MSIFKITLIFGLVALVFSVKGGNIKNKTSKVSENEKPSEDVTERVDDDVSKVINPKKPLKGESGDDKNTSQENEKSEEPEDECEDDDDVSEEGDKSEESEDECVDDDDVSEEGDKSEEPEDDCVDDDDTLEDENESAEESSKDNDTKSGSSSSPIAGIPPKRILFPRFPPRRLPWVRIVKPVPPKLLTDKDIIKLAPKDKNEVVEASFHSFSKTEKTVNGVKVVDNKEVKEIKNRNGKVSISDKKSRL